MADMPMTAGDVKEHFPPRSGKQSHPIFCLSEWPRGFTVKALPMSMDELIMRTLIHNTVMTDHSSYTFKTREEAEAFFIAAALRERARQSSDLAAQRGGGNRGPDVRKEKTRSRRAP